METLNKLLEVIDNNSQDMPEGVYLQLMNLLKEQHKELNNNKNVVINEPVQQVQEPVQVEEPEPAVVEDVYERIKVKNLQVGDIIVDFKDYNCSFHNYSPQRFSSPAQPKSSIWKHPPL
jgi:hypothetical protein